MSFRITAHNEGHQAVLVVASRRDTKQTKSFVIHPGHQMTLPPEFYSNIEVEKVEISKETGRG